MRRFLKWAAIIIVILLILGFGAFLYLIPPFTIAPPETFSQDAANAAPKVDSIADMRERLIAQHGRYLVLTHDCAGCHTPPAPDGSPDNSRYLAGGMKISAKGVGSAISRNLTPDPETGLGARSLDEIAYHLRTGQFHTGRLLNGRAMPWPVFSNLTDEDRYAIAVYLRHLKPIHNRIPDADTQTQFTDTTAALQFAGGDYSGH